MGRSASLVLPSRWSTSRPRPNAAAQAMRPPPAPSARRLGGVDRLGRGQAEVALAAGLRRPSRRSSGARRRRGSRSRRAWRRAGAPCAPAPGAPRRAASRPAIRRRAQAMSAGAVEGDALGRLAVASGAADLLPIGLDRGRRIGVDHEAHVRLVDAHAEGDGRHHHRLVLGQEPVSRSARTPLQPGVVGHGRRRPRPARSAASVSVAFARCRHRRRRSGPRRALTSSIDRACRRARLALGRQAPAPAGRSWRRIRARSAAAARRGCPRGCARRRWRSPPGAGRRGRARRGGPSVRYSGRKSWPHWLTQWASSMAISARAMARQPLQHHGCIRPSGRQVEQVELARLDPPPGLRSLVRRGVGIQPRGGHARLLQRRHLVGHQRDQRRDHQAHAGAHQGGDLVAEALAAAGGQHRQRAAPGQQLARSHRPAARESRHGRRCGAGFRAHAPGRRAHRVRQAGGNRRSRPQNGASEAAARGSECVRRMGP